MQILNYSSALLLSVPIILCKKPFTSQPFVNRLATMGRRWAWYEKCRTGKGIQHNDTYNFYKAMLHIYIYRLRFHPSVQMKSKMCSELSSVCQAFSFPRGINPFGQYQRLGQVPILGWLKDRGLWESEWLSSSRTLWLFPSVGLLYLHILSPLYMILQ